MNCIGTVFRSPVELVAVLALLPTLVGAAAGVPDAGPAVTLNAVTASPAPDSRASTPLPKLTPEVDPIWLAWSELPAIRRQRELAREVFGPEWQSPIASIRVSEPALQGQVVEWSAGGARGALQAISIRAFGPMLPEVFANPTDRVPSMTNVTCAETAVLVSHLRSDGHVVLALAHAIGVEWNDLEGVRHVDLVVLALVPGEYWTIENGESIAHASPHRSGPRVLDRDVGLDSGSGSARERIPTGFGSILIDPMMLPVERAEGGEKRADPSIIGWPSWEQLRCAVVAARLSFLLTGCIACTTLCVIPEPGSIVTCPCAYFACCEAFESFEELLSDCSDIETSGAWELLAELVETFCILSGLPAPGQG